jgi:hypothetical protein
MISWIVASHDPATLEENLLATLDPSDEDEVIIVWHADSIAEAYTQGQANATRPIRCFVHHDIQVIDPLRLRTELELWCASAGIGLVGLVGSRSPHIPWWEGPTCGSVDDARIGVLNNGPGGECVILDGLLLATMHEIAWDTDLPGWHGYDHDASLQAHAAGRVNWCLSRGHELVRHNTTGPASMSGLTGWDEAAAWLRDKWGDGVGAR